VDGVDAIVANLPNIGVGGVVVWLLVYFMRHSSSDRADYRTALKEERQQHATELAARDERIDKLQARIDELARQLDAERQERFDFQRAMVRMQRGEA
jgi:Skp family chaperone for outer membrane proteins